MTIAVSKQAITTCLLNQLQAQPEIAAVEPYTFAGKSIWHWLVPDSATAPEFFPIAPVFTADTSADSIHISVAYSWLERPSRHPPPDDSVTAVAQQTSRMLAIVASCYGIDRVTAESLTNLRLP